MTEEKQTIDYYKWLLRQRIMKRKKKRKAYKQRKDWIKTQLCVEPVIGNLFEVENNEK